MSHTNVGKDEQTFTPLTFFLSKWHILYVETTNHVYSSALQITGDEREVIKNKTND